MDLSHPVSARPEDLARTVAALANSGGGRCVVEGDPETGTAALRAALRNILPPPRFLGPEGDRRHEEASILHTGIVRPAEVTAGVVQEGIVVSVVPGTSLCTLGGVVYVFEEGAIRALTLAEVVRRAGSGG